MSFRLLSLALGTFVVGTQTFLIAGVLPAIAADLSVSVAAAAQLITIFSLTYAVASPVLPTVLAGVPPRRLLLGVLGLFAVANVLAALAPDYHWLALARVLSAAGAALFTPTASATAVGVAGPGQRGRALAVVAIGLTLATVLGVPLGTWIGLTYGWRASFWLIFLLSAVAIRGIAASLPPLPPLPTVALAQRLALLRDARFAAALAVTVAWTAGVSAVYTYVNPLLHELAGADDSQLVGLLLVWGLASAVGSWIGGSGADRWSPRRTVGASLALLGLNFLLLPFTATSLPGAALALALWGAAGWAIWAPQQHRLIDLAPSVPGLALALNASTLYLGMALGSAVGSLAVEQLSIASVAPLGGLFELLGLAVLLAAPARAQVPRLHLARGAANQRAG